MNSYREITEWLETNQRLIAVSASTVRKMKDEKVESLAVDIIQFIKNLGIERTLDLYSQRVSDLGKMMSAFKKTGKYPNVGENLGVSLEAYNVTLLYSYIFAINRFEIFEFYTKFLSGLKRENGTLAGVGIGTGYELKIACDMLSSWNVIGYEKEKESVEFAKKLFKHYGYDEIIDVHNYFPMAYEDDISDKYDVILMIELLEHLEQPGIALEVAGKSLNDTGTMFVTMAVNIPQEDHIYHYESIEECRDQIAKSGFGIVEEMYSPSVIMPFADADREKVSSGNYMALIEKR
jgi:2-polyprenyl-3-methyl-5-hydroxy-6-metoxy-1,4-benzoquinol methylase